MSKELSEETKTLMYVNELIKNVEEYKNKTGIDKPTICISQEALIDIQQYILKSQEQENENARLKEILINGFRDKNAVFHKQTYLAFIDDGWCICDLQTDEWFLVKEVL